MSYINKRGKTTATRVMIIRQQVSDAISYHEIKTTITKAKETQKRLDKLVTWAKEDSIANRRLASRWLVNTQKADAKELLKHLFDKIGPAFKERPGGYTRVLKLGKRQGDATEMAILQFVQKIPELKIKTKAAPKKVETKAAKPIAAK